MIRIHNRFLKNRFERRVREVAANTSNTQDGTPPPEGAGGAKSSGLAPGVITAGEERPAGHSSAAETTENPVSASGQDFQTTTTRSLPPPAVAEDIGYEVDEQARSRGPEVATTGDAWRRRGSRPNSRNPALGETGGEGLENSPFPDGVSSQICVVSQESIEPDGGGDGDIDGNECETEGSSRYRGPDSAASSSVTKKEGKENKLASSSKRSSGGSRMRSLEYLFFTGRTAGCRSGGQGFDDSNGNCRDTSCCGVVGDHQQPDLLKLAEDGFLVADWNEITKRGTGTGAEGLDKSPPQPSRQSHENVLGARSVTDEQREGRNGVNRWSSCGATTFSSHLSEADIPGITGTKAANASTEGHESCEFSDHDADGAAELFTEGKGDIHNSIVPPVCRVLVVKVYTGQSLRMGDSGGATDMDGSGGGALLDPDVLKGAWNKGFKSVCVSSLGGGGGTDGGGGERSSASGAFRDQVRESGKPWGIQYSTRYRCNS